MYRSDWWVIYSEWLGGEKKGNKVQIILSKIFDFKCKERDMMIAEAHTHTHKSIYIHICIYK